jgi:hypothetical protein
MTCGDLSPVPSTTNLSSPTPRRRDRVGGHEHRSSGVRSLARGRAPPRQVRLSLITARRVGVAVRPSERAAAREKTVSSSLAADVACQRLPRCVRRAVVFASADDDRGEHQAGHHSDEECGHDRCRRGEEAVVARDDTIEDERSYQADSSADRGAERSTMEKMRVRGQVRSFPIRSSGPRGGKWGGCLDPR